LLFISVFAAQERGQVTLGLGLDFALADVAAGSVATEMGFAGPQVGECCGEPAGSTASVLAKSTAAPPRSGAVPRR
jgi:hypothetical protein